GPVVAVARRHTWRQQSQNPDLDLPARRRGWTEHRRAALRKALLRNAAEHRHRGTRQAEWRNRPRRTLRPASIAAAAQTALGLRTTRADSRRRLAGSESIAF